MQSNLFKMKTKPFLGIMILIGSLFILINGCTVEEDEPARKLKIGDEYGGGIVFYVDSTGQHGLIAAPSNQNSAVWGCDSTYIGGTGRGIGMGRANTLAIVNGCSQAGTAARICDDLVLNGYDDWFLPSVEEFFLMCEENSVIGRTDFEAYWTSTEVGPNGAICCYCGYYDSEYLPKDRSGNVRAVRAF